MNKLHLSSFHSLLFGMIFLIALSPAAVLAQQPSPLLTPMVKEYGRPGYPQITVYVWGNADTGVWSVEEGTDLLEFASVISRIQLEERAPDRRSIRWLRIYREGRTGGAPFFESRIEDLFTERARYPQLEEGDILALETEARGRFTWRDVTRVVSTVGTLLNTYLIIDRIRQN